MLAGVRSKKQTYTRYALAVQEKAHVQRWHIFPLNAQNGRKHSAQARQRR